MIKLIVGTKGSGKTKAMIDQINDAVKTSKGNVVVLLPQATRLRAITSARTNARYFFMFH